MASDSYVRTHSLSKRVGGVVVTVLHTSGEYADATTATIAKDSHTIEVFASDVAAIARAVKDMVALLEADKE